MLGGGAHHAVGVSRDQRWSRGSEFDLHPWMSFWCFRQKRDRNDGAQQRTVPKVLQRTAGTSAETLDHLWSRSVGVGGGRRTWSCFRS